MFSCILNSEAEGNHQDSVSVFPLSPSVKKVIVQLRFSLSPVMLEAAPRKRHENFTRFLLRPNHSNP